MRLHRSTIAWLGVFRTPVTLDLDALAPARFIAITGPNGGGKSTLCELAILGALFRRTASRGDMADLATARGAYVESEFTAPDGLRFRLKQSADAETGNGASLLTDVHGAPLLDASGVSINPAASRKVHDAWAKAYLPDPAVLLASQFAAQEPSRALGGKGTAGLLTMSDTERRSVVLRAQGAERYDRMHERGRERLRDVTAALVRVGASIEAEVALGGTATAASDDLTKCRANLANAEAEAQAATEETNDARAKVGVHLAAVAAAEDLRKKHDAAHGRHAAAVARVADLDQRLSNNRQALDDADRIRAAVAREAALDAEIEDTRGRIDRSLSEALAARTRAGQEAEALRVASAALDAVERHQREVAARLVDRADVVAAAEVIAGLREAAERTNDAYKLAAQAYESARDAASNRSDVRIDGLRGGLATLADQAAGRLVEPAHVFATKVLAADDALCADASPAVEALRLDVERTRAASYGAAEAYRLKYPTAARLPDIRAAEMELNRIDVDLTAARVAAGIVRIRSVSAQSDVDRAETAITAERNRLAGLEHESPAVHSLARRAVVLAVAEARIAELQVQIDEARVEVASAKRDLEALDPLQALAEAPDHVGLDRLEQASQAAAEIVAKARVAVAVAEDSLRRAEACKERVVSLQEVRQRHEADSADWTFLTQGMRLVQADLADSAGPQLAAVANDLLRASVGSRWTLHVQTTREGSRGQTIEGYGLRIIDAETGREGDASTYSPGERAILGAAIADAVSTLAAKHAKLRDMTLVRDEVDAPLSASRAAGWLEMTRLTMDLTGASQCLIITHNPHVIAGCDVVLAVNDGALEVVR